MSDKFYDDWRQAHGGKPHPHTRQVVMELKDRDVWEDLDALARGLCAKLRAKTGWTGRIESQLETNVMVDAGGNEYGKATVRASAWVPTEMADRFDHTHVTSHELTAEDIARVLEVPVGLIEGSREARETLSRAHLAKQSESGATDDVD